MQTPGEGVGVGQAKIGDKRVPGGGSSKWEDPESGQAKASMMGEP